MEGERGGERGRREGEERGGGGKEEKRKNNMHSQSEWTIGVRTYVALGV